MLRGAAQRTIVLKEILHCGDVYLRDTFTFPI
jgi:hypothetical protein